MKMENDQNMEEENMFHKTEVFVLLLFRSGLSNPSSQSPIVLGDLLSSSSFWRELKFFGAEEVKRIAGLNLRDNIKGHLLSRTLFYISGVLVKGRKKIKPSK